MLASMSSAHETCGAKLLGLTIGAGGAAIGGRAGCRRVAQLLGEEGSEAPAALVQATQWLLVREQRKLVGAPESHCRRRFAAQIGETFSAKFAPPSSSGETGRPRERGALRFIRVGPAGSGWEKGNRFISKTRTVLQSGTKPDRMKFSV